MILNLLWVVRRVDYLGGSMKCLDYHIKYHKVLFWLNPGNFDYLGDSMKVIKGYKLVQDTPSHQHHKI